MTEQYEVQQDDRGEYILLSNAGGRHLVQEYSTKKEAEAVAKMLNAISGKTCPECGFDIYRTLP